MQRKRKDIFWISFVRINEKKSKQKLIIRKDMKKTTQSFNAKSCPSDLQFENVSFFAVQFWFDFSPISILSLLEVLRFYRACMVQNTAFKQ